MSQLSERKRRWMAFCFPLLSPLSLYRLQQGTRRGLPTVFRAKRAEREHDSRARTKEEKEVCSSRAAAEEKPNAKKAMLRRCCSFSRLPRRGASSLTIRVQRVDWRVQQGDDGDAAVDLEGRSRRHAGQNEKKRAGRKKRERKASEKRGKARSEAAFFFFFFFPRLRPTASFLFHFSFPVNSPFNRTTSLLFSFFRNDAVLLLLCSRILRRRVFPPRQRDLAVILGLRRAQDHGRRRRRLCRPQLEQQAAQKVRRRLRPRSFVVARFRRGEGRRDGPGRDLRRALRGQDRRPEGAAEADRRHHRRELGPRPRRGHRARQER